MKKITFLLLILGSSLQLHSQELVDISENQWNIWLDYDAEWENDALYLPPVDITALPVNEPTLGWDGLYAAERKATTIPATVEQYFWGQNGNDFGVAGNYVGVSWFSTEIDVPATWEGKRVVINFESARLRAEVYINGKIAGYDIINGTPFSVDVTEFVNYGSKNKLDVRITDPNGNFAWRDWETYGWGNYDITPSHGFGGITGKVTLEASDKTFIEDVFVKNTPEVNKIDVVTTLSSFGTIGKGTIQYKVVELPNNKEVFSANENVENQTEINSTIKLDNARLWTPDTPNLYNLVIEWNGEDGSTYSTTKRFGFRWFEVVTIGDDKQFHLNGKRVVLRTAISWGHWPVNGIYPSDEMAEKQVRAAKALGLNCLNFHRGIGQTNVLEMADEIGLMYYAEPGGYAAGRSEFTEAMKREKLMRMVKNFRSHPSLVIYNMINEAVFPLKWEKVDKPYPSERRDMIDAHKLDETRPITYTSTCWFKPISTVGCPVGPHDIKMCMLPYDTVVYNDIWWDEHHAGGPGVYRDEFYNGKDDIYRHNDIPNEIIILGEDGAVGTPPRLDLIVESLDEIGYDGWDGDTYRKMQKVYSDFLKAKGFSKDFPSVDYLCQSMGNVSHYYQARTIENTRIGNLLDGYVINGWENTKVENHSGVVDIFRNLKTDEGTLAYYNQPFYVAIKAQNKVLEVGEVSSIDFYIVNEEDVKGNLKLNIVATDDEGVLYEKTHKVTLTGGTTYGELIVEGVELKTRTKGYINIKTELLKGKEVIAEGKEKLFAISLNTDNLPVVAVVDTSGAMQKYLDMIPGVKYENTKSPQGIENGKVLLVGKDIQPGMVPGAFRQTSPVMDWVSRGNTMIIADGFDEWCKYLNHKEILDYRGFRKIDRNWFGGNHFVKEHSLFNELPTKQAFNWEYQSFAAYKRNRNGMRIANGETVVGVTADHKHEVYSAVVVIPHGRGNIIISSLDIAGALDEKKDKANVMAKKVLLNFIAFGK